VKRRDLPSGIFCPFFPWTCDFVKLEGFVKESGRGHSPVFLGATFSPFFGKVRDDHSESLSRDGNSSPFWLFTDFYPVPPFFFLMRASPLLTW